MIIYVKFLYTDNENKAKRYLGMLASILGQRLSDHAINNIIYTKPGDFFGFQKFSYKMFYWGLISD